MIGFTRNTFLLSSKKIPNAIYMVKSWSHIEITHYHFISGVATARVTNEVSMEKMLKDIDADSQSLVRDAFCKDCSLDQELPMFLL